jgi:hypothetical protein
VGDAAARARGRLVHPHVVACCMPTILRPCTGAVRGRQVYRGQYCDVCAWGASTVSRCASEGWLMHRAPPSINAESSGAQVNEGGGDAEWGWIDNWVDGAYLLSQG